MNVGRVRRRERAVVRLGLHALAVPPRARAGGRLRGARLLRRARTRRARRTRRTRRARRAALARVRRRAREAHLRRGVPGPALRRAQAELRRHALLALLREGGRRLVPAPGTDALGYVGRPTFLYVIAL